MNNFKGKHGPLLIAEIGGNHEGNFEYAKKLTEYAISTDVDYVKFQLYSGDTLVNPLENPDRNKHFKKFELTKEQHITLAKMVRNAGIGYMASVWDEAMMKWIDPYMSIYKVGSGDMTAYPIIKAIAKYNKPMIISTGLSKEQEVLDLVNFVQSLNNIYQSPENFAILQCTSMYPIKDSDSNLSVIPRLKELTKLTVGYSDHTEGTKALEIAYAMGADILEFHFTDTKKGKTFRDHLVSLTPESVNKLIENIKQINVLKGSPEKKPLPIEIENGHHISFRRAVYPAMDIPAGTIIKEKHLTTLRPNHGISSKDFFTLIGKTTKINLKKLQPLNFEYFK